MLTAKQIVARRIRNNVIFPVILFFFLTIGNYSFFRYSIYGIENVPVYLKLAPYIRLFIPAWIIGYCLRINPKLTSRILTDNFDIVLLGISWMISSLLSLDVASYLFYGTWTLFSLMSILLFISYSSIISGTKSEFLLTTLNVLWAGNFVILILDIATIIFMKPHGGMYQIIFSSNTFWAYPTMVLGILAVLKMRFTTESLFKKVYFLCIFLVCVVTVYFSARRSPLFALILASILIFIPPKTPQILIITSLFIFFYILLSSSTGEKVIKSLPDSYMKYRIERMSGLIKGRKETSYSERQKIWKIYLNRFYEKPVFGEGLASAQRINSVRTDNREGISAHNTFIGLLAETGLSGAFLMLVVLGRNFYFLVKTVNAKWIKIYIILFIPTLIINWVEYNLIPGQIFFLYTMVIWIMPRGLQNLSR
ncbi:O-antigen ligase family protein [Dyadobacter sp. CY345]|uniref:O-antigen ligase family protein n=1 Tax=Dyadobacter sp. CY345 TaxID=2909335 RepID=UPI001F480051|nr:O-antigen ligase family protein [Dyadobacter sp. CY345]MCF2446180.1 O-antigen ligase family protein [Dyadobacter sp. CY345]